MIIKAVIAAAGKGTRMLHLSKDRPKHLIAVNEKPFLYYVLENLKKAGIKKMIIVVGYKKEAMEKFAEEYKNEFNITLVDQFENRGADRYGTAIPIEAVRKTVGNEPFISIYGDNLYSPKDIAKFAKDSDYNYIGVMENENPEKYGVAVADENDILVRIVEKPKEFVSNMINTGIYTFTPEVFEVLPKDKSPRGEYELTDAIQKLAEKKRVKIIRLAGGWMDFGNPDDIIKVSEFLNKNKESTR